MIIIDLHNGFYAKYGKIRNWFLNLWKRNYSKQRTEKDFGHTKVWNGHCLGRQYPYKKNVLGKKMKSIKCSSKLFKKKSKDSISQKYGCNPKLSSVRPKSICLRQKIMSKTKEKWNIEPPTFIFWEHKTFR